MHPQRWGDPAAAAALPDSARGLIELAFGINETPALDAVTVPAVGALRRAARLAARRPRRRARARRRRDPAAAHPREVDPRPAPRPRRRPVRRPRRRGPSGLARRRRRRPRLGGRAPRRGGALRWRHLRDRRPGRAPRRLRRAGLARPGPDEAAGLRRPRVHDRRPRAGAARPRGRGAARRRGRAARPLPAVLRVRHDRRLRGHPVLRPVQRGLRPLRRPGRRPPRRDAAWRGAARLRPCERRRPGPAPAVPRLGGRLRRDHRGDRAGPEAARGEGLRGLALGVVRGRCRRDADPGPGRDAADRPPPLRRGRDRDQPGAARRDRRREASPRAAA